MDLLFVIVLFVLLVAIYDMIRRTNKNIIEHSEDYKASEITGGKIIDFGYAESIEGWEQGFNFVKKIRPNGN